MIPDQISAIATWKGIRSGGPTGKKKKKKKDRQQLKSFSRLLWRIRCIFFFYFLAFFSVAGSLFLILWTQQNAGHLIGGNLPPSPLQRGSVTYQANNGNEIRFKSHKSATGPRFDSQFPFNSRPRKWHVEFQSKKERQRWCFHHLSFVAEFERD